MKEQNINPKQLPHNENKIIRDVYYKSRQSYENKRGWFRSYFNQVRENKEAKYKKVDTTKFTNLIYEMLHYENMEYICAGLNSFEREVVVIDCDDTDRGELTLKLLKEANLEPHMMKVKKNGHSQFYFFVQKFYIGEGGFYNGKYYETDFYDNHQKWKWLNRKMNVLFNGDVGYTGYNCQNPFFKDAESYVFRSLDELYTVDELCERVNELLSNPVILEYVNETIYKFYSERKQNTKATQKILTKVHFLDEEEVERLAQESREELKRKLQEIAEKKKITNNEEINQLIDEIEHISSNFINKRIFVLCSQVCKSFWNRGLLHNEEYTDEIVNTCLSNWNYQDNALGYNFHELKTRIMNDVYYIQQRDLHNTMLWEKVGYTKKQRDISLKTRRMTMIMKKTRVMKIFNDNIDNFKALSKVKSLTLNTVIKFIKANYKMIYNEDISVSSIRLYLIKQYKNIILFIKSYNKTKLKVIPHHHNNKLTTLTRMTPRVNSKRVMKLLLMGISLQKEKKVA